MNKEVLVIIAWIIIVSVLLSCFHERIGNRFPNTFLKESSHIPSWFWIIWIVRGSILMSVLGILIDFRLSYTTDIEKIEEQSTLIVLDISKSMQSDDIQPSRLDSAKSAIYNILKYDISEKMWLIIFAGKTFLMSPPAYDTAWLLGLLKQITTDTIDQSISDTSGTNIGDALIQAISTLEKWWTWKRYIVLITDGRSNIGIDPLIALEEAKKQNIIIYTIWIWSASWTALSYVNAQGIRQYFYDTYGNTIQADRDDTTLTQIAEKTWGRYLIWSDGEKLQEIVREINKSISHKKIYTRSSQEFRLTPYLIMAIILLSMLHGFVHARLRKKYNL